MRSGLLNFDDDFGKNEPGNELDFKGVENERLVEAQISLLSAQSEKTEIEMSAVLNTKDREAVKSDEVKTNIEESAKNKVKDYEAYFNKFRLTAQDIREYTQEWLINDFIVKPSLVNIFASGGAGKSYFTLHLATWLLSAQKTSKVFYFDGDNGMGVYSRRKLDILLENYPNLYYTSAAKVSRDDDELNKDELIADLFQWAKIQPAKFKDALIIIDSIRDFFRGDMAKDSHVIPVMDQLKKIRNRGATIIFLHHQPKQSANPEDNNKSYKGATAFIDSVDEAYYFCNRTKESDKGRQIIATLEPVKRRDGAKPQAFILDTITLNLTRAEYADYALTDKEALTIEYAEDIISEHSEGLTQSALSKELTRRAKDDGVELVGLNALWALLSKYNNKRFTVTADFIVFIACQS